jgi:RNA polymerase sigma-70 factor (ECF subfamily)
MRTAIMRLDGTLSIPLLGAECRTSEVERARLRKAFDRNYVGVWRFLRRMGVAPDRADDAAQQVFLIALEALGRIIEGSERAFLYATAVRLAHGMRRTVQREFSSGMLDLDPSPIPAPDQLTSQKRAREVLDSLIARMDDDHRAVFVLSEFDDFTIREIAGLLDIPVGTAASRLRRAREKFQLLVRQTYGEQL